MRIFRPSHLSIALLLLSVPAFAGPRRATKSHTHASIKRSSSSTKRGRTAAHHESVSMPPERATAIQTALIKQGYLSGEPTGQWDPSTVSAMQKLQSDNGWQSRVTPDSRALIKLGLGPDTPHEATQAPPNL